MLSRLIPRRRPSTGTCIALIALFVALGGPAQAAKLVNGKDIKKGTITSRQVKKGGVSGDRIKPGSLPLGRLTASAISRLQETPPGEVDVQKIADGAVNSSKVADKSLKAADIGEFEIGPRLLAQNSVTGFAVAPSSIDTEEIVDGRLKGRDIGAFLGKGDFEFGDVPANGCKQATAAAVEVPPAGERPRDLTDDVILATPESNFITGFAEGKGFSYFARAESPSVIGIVLCNHTGALLQARKHVFRYITFDTEGD